MQKRGLCARGARKTAKSTRELAVWAGILAEKGCHRQREGVPAEGRKERRLGDSRDNGSFREISTLFGEQLMLQLFQTQGREAEDLSGPSFGGAAGDLPVIQVFKEEQEVDP